jgi:hypothetical protein
MRGDFDLCLGAEPRACSRGRSLSFPRDTASVGGHQPVRSIVAESRAVTAAAFRRKRVPVDAVTDGVAGVSTVYCCRMMGFMMRRGTSTCVWRRSNFIISVLVTGLRSLSTSSSATSGLMAAAVAAH